LSRLTPNEYATKHLKQLEEYINDVQSGSRIVCQFEKQAVTRFIKNYKLNFEYKESELIRSLKFFSLINIAFKGDVVQFPLQPFQVFIIASVYCFYYKGTDQRVINEAILSTAGKNGKSSFVIGLSLFESVSDFELNANIILTSLTNRQSAEVLKYLKEMIMLSPLLSELFKVNHSTVYNKQANSTNFIQIITNDEDKAQGSNPSVSILDEVFLYKDLKIKDILKKKSSTRKNPLQLIIGTFSNKEAVSYEHLFLPCVSILNGEAEKDNLFIFFATQDDVREIDNPESWVKSNPSLGAVQSVDNMLEAFNNIKIFPTSKRVFLNDSLNIWQETNLLEKWLEDEIVKAAFTTDTIPANSVIYIGIDASTNTDLTGLSIIAEVAQDQLLCKTINVMPNAANNFLKKNVDLSKWFVSDTAEYLSNDFVSVKTEDENGKQKVGCIYPCKTPVLDEDLIFEIILRLSNRFKIKSIGYDPFNAQQLIYKLEKKGITCNPVPQNVKHLSFPLKFIEKNLITGKFKFEYNPCTRWQFGNVDIFTDTNANIKLMKKKIDGVAMSIDALVATNIAVHQYLADNMNRFSDLLSAYNF